MFIKELYCTVLYTETVLFKVDPGLKKFEKPCCIVIHTISSELTV